MNNLRFMCLAIACIISFILISTSTFAQENESFPVINRIIPEFSSFRSVSDQYIFSNIQLRSGMNYNPTLADQSIRSLYGTGQFEFVEVILKDAQSDTVDVIFKLVSKYTIAQIKFNGNETYSDSRLASKCGFESDQPLDEYQVSMAKDEIQAYYVEKGYADAEVDYRIQRDKDTGKAIVNFDIDEGIKIRIEKINFTGNKAFKKKKLLGQMEIAEHGWLSFMTGSG
ncbi:MAG: POTRA domain-containing protein, partial [Verrucomicrobiota bacterium]|nr:POTRA domain-containing protein [Verrucomicrobiota bacterium]